MSCLLWLRPTHFVRFTSLRDMSLRRNVASRLRPHALFAHGANKALMRGLRA